MYFRELQYICLRYYHVLDQVGNFLDKKKFKLTLITA